MPVGEDLARFDLSWFARTERALGGKATVTGRYEEPETKQEAGPVADSGDGSLPPGSGKGAAGDTEYIEPSTKPAHPTPSYVDPGRPEQSGPHYVPQAPDTGPDQFGPPQSGQIEPVLPEPAQQDHVQPDQAGGYAFPPAAADPASAGAPAHVQYPPTQSGQVPTSAADPQAFPGPYSEGTPSGGQHYGSLAGSYPAPGTQSGPHPAAPAWGQPAQQVPGYPTGNPAPQMGQQHPGQQPSGQPYPGQPVQSGPYQVGTPEPSGPYDVGQQLAAGQQPVGGQLPTQQVGQAPGHQVPGQPYSSGQYGNGQYGSAQYGNGQPAVSPYSESAPPVPGVDQPKGQDLSSAQLLRPAKRIPRSGWRRAVYLLSGKMINLGESPADRRRRELIARINQPLQGCYKIAMLSLKGGVGKTTATATLGATFASLRGDRVVAVDANPDRGTLSQKIPLETTATVRHLLRDAQHIRKYSDVRSYTSQGPSRLEILASEQDPAVSEAFSEGDYQRTANVLEHFYNVVLTDCGTGLMHSAMKGVLDQADSLVIVSSSSIDGARSASATVDWLDAHGYGELVSRSVAVINGVRPSAGKVDTNKLAAHFQARCRAVAKVPFDAHLEEGAEVDLDRLAAPTRLAMLELAAVVADDFPYAMGRQSAV